MAEVNKINSLSNKKNNLKLDWIFGIRSDMFPNVFVLDFETIVYPA